MASCSTELQERIAPRWQAHYPLVIAVVTSEDDENSRLAWHSVRVSHRAQRDGIRATWKEEVRAAGVPFFFARSSAGLTASDIAERETHRDILLLDDPDGAARGFRGLSAKTLLLMQFMARQCATLKYLIKCDDDTFVNVPRLLLFVQHAPDLRSIAGYAKVNLTAQKAGLRATPGYETHTGLPKYPRHLHGGGYLLSGDVVRTLGIVSLEIPMLLWQGREDLSLSTWLIGWNLTVVNMRHNALFINFSRNYTRAPKRIVLCRDRWIFAHRVSCATFPEFYQEVCIRRGPSSEALRDFEEFLVRNVLPRAQH